MASLRTSTTCMVRPRPRYVSYYVMTSRHHITHTRPLLACFLLFFLLLQVSLGVRDRLRDQPDGNYVVVTGINPTPLGEGKVDQHINRYAHARIDILDTDTVLRSSHHEWTNRLLISCLCLCHRGTSQPRSSDSHRPWVPTWGRRYQQFLVMLCECCWLKCHPSGLSRLLLVSASQARAPPSG